ncbi:probable transmembrane ascorbate ferrireductase 2, partial [Phtheirospermum japonicum]
LLYSPLVVGPKLPPLVCNSVGYWIRNIWYPSRIRNSRARLFLWYVFSGIYIYALAVTTCTTGFLKKATLLQMKKLITGYSTGAFLLNSLDIMVVVCLVL